MVLGSEQQSPLQPADLDLQPKRESTSLDHGNCVVGPTRGLSHGHCVFSLRYIASHLALDRVRSWLPGFVGGGVELASPVSLLMLREFLERGGSYPVLLRSWQGESRSPSAYFVSMEAVEAWTYGRILLHPIAYPYRVVCKPDSFANDDPCVLHRFVTDRPLRL